MTKIIKYYDQFLSWKQDLRFGEHIVLVIFAIFIFTISYILRAKNNHSIKSHNFNE